MKKPRPKASKAKVAQTTKIPYWEAKTLIWFGAVFPFLNILFSEPLIGDSPRAGQTFLLAMGLTSLALGLLVWWVYDRTLHLRSHKKQTIDLPLFSVETFRLLLVPAGVFVAGLIISLTITW